MAQQPQGVSSCRIRVLRARIIPCLTQVRISPTGASFFSPPKSMFLPNIHITMCLQRRAGFLHHGPLPAISHASPVRCQAGSPDPDDYEHDPGYDSDDYEILETSAAAPRPASSTSSAASPPSTSRFPLKVEGLPPLGKRQVTKEAIKTGFNIFLLFGAAIDRFVSRAQTAAIAAGIALLALLRRASLAGAVRARASWVKASQSFNTSAAGRKLDNWSQSIDELQRELPEDTWGKLLWLWDRPPVQRLRLTVSMANLSIRLPALLALVATQVGLLASQVSLPMLAPLLLGTGMLLRSIKSNASFLLPRIGLLVVMLWMLWFVNSVVHNTVAYLRKQNALDNRLAGGIITVSECSTLVVALVVLLSMLGVNVSALLLPAGIAMAVAAKDLSHNFLAGLFLFVVQPFKLGDRLSVASSTPGTGGPTGGWFEGVCEKVDLRYTIVRQGRRRLMVPNSAFITREFMVLDDGPVGENQSPSSSAGAEQPGHMQPFMTSDYRRVWQYVEGPPVHQELAATYHYPPPGMHPYPPGPPTGPPQQQQQPEAGPVGPTLAGNPSAMPLQGKAGSQAGAQAPIANGANSSTAVGEAPVVDGNSVGDRANSAAILNEQQQRQQQQERLQQSPPPPAGAVPMQQRNIYPAYVIDRPPGSNSTQYYTHNGAVPYGGAGSTGGQQQAGARSPPADLTVNAVNGGYWQGSQMYQQPLMPGAGMPMAHPLSPEAWHQAQDNINYNNKQP